MAAAGSQHIKVGKAANDTLGAGLAMGSSLAQAGPGQAWREFFSLSVVISRRCCPVLAAARRTWPCLVTAAESWHFVPLQECVLPGVPRRGLH